MQHEIGIKLNATGAEQVNANLQQVNAGLGGLNARIETVRTALGGLGPVLAGSLSVGALTAWVKSSINALDALNDASDATGAAVEELSKLEVVALRNGESLDLVTTSLLKFNQQLNSVDGKNGASLALQAIGVDAERLRKLDPAVALREVARALGEFENSGAKARVMQELFGKSTREVAAYLKDLGEAGEIAATVTSDVADEAERLAKQMAGVSATVDQAGRMLAKELLPTLNALANGFIGTAGELSAMDVAAEAAKVTLQTLAVLGANVAYVFVSVGREIGAAAAQIAALGRGDLDGFSAIARQVSEDAEAARKKLDEFERSVMGASAAAAAGAGRGFVNPETAKRQLRDLQDMTAAQKALEAAQKAAAAAAKEAEKLRAESIAYAARITSDAAKASNAYADSLDKAAESIETENQRLREQYIELTAGKEALAAVVALRLEERAVALERAADATGWELEAEQLRTQARLLREQIALRQGITEATAAQEAERANTEAAKKAQEEWQRASDQIGQALADALMQGGKSAAEYIRGLFRTMVLRPVIQAAVQPYANAVLGLMGVQQGQGAAGQAGQYLQGAQSLQTLYGYGQAGYGYLAANGYFGSAAAAYVSPAAAQAAYGGAAAEIAGSGAGASASSGAASMAGYAGWAALAVAAAIQAQKDYDVGFNRESSSNSGTALGDASARTADLFSRLGLNDKWADIISGATLTARLFGRAAPQVTGSGVQGSFGGGDFTGQAYADIYEKGGVFRSGKAYQQFAALPDDLSRFLDTAAAAVMTKAEEFGAALGLPVAELSNVTTDIKLNLGDALGSNEEDITNALAAYGDALVAGWTDALKPVALYGETTLQTIERVGAAIKATNDVLALLDVGMLDASVAGGQAAAALAAAFGSLDSLTQASAAYYQNYFSEAERASKATEQLAQALAGVGLALPASRDQFRALVQGLDLATEAGRQQFVVLMQVQGAFAELNPVVAETAAAARSAADVLRERQSLELDLLRLQGDTAAIRALERAALDASNQALYDQIAALQDTQAAAAQAAAVAAEAAAVAADAAAAQQQRLQAIADETAGLELELLGLQGNTAEIRARERAALLSDEARAIYDQINALKDSQAQWKDAGTAAVTAASSAASAWTSTWQSMAEEVKRLRGSQAVGGNALLAEFATATAQARAGDVAAAGKLAGLSKSLSEEGRNTSGTRADFDVLNAKLAASLERTLQKTGAPAELLAGLRTDGAQQHADNMAAAAQTLTLLRRVSQMLDKFDADGMPAVRT